VARVAILLVSMLFLSACSSTESDPLRVFESAFGQTPPADVEALHGYRLERRRFFVITEAMWRLHLSGPGAVDFVRARWPDLEAATVRSYVQGSQTPWFAPGREVKYVTWKSPSDPAVMVMLHPQSKEVYVAYDPF
jgi:hypothetical protein